MKSAVEFRKNWTRAVERSGLSLAHLGRLSGNSASKMQDIASGKYDEAKDGPGLFGIHRTIQPLDTSLDRLLPIGSQPRPGLNSFLSCYRGPGTSIEKFSQVLGFCDIYRKPSRDVTNLDRLGPQSLLVQVSGISDPALLQLEFESWAASKKAKVYNRQLRAWTDGHVVDTEVYDARFERSSLHPHFALLLAACRIVDFDAREKLIVYAEPLIYNP